MITKEESTILKGLFMLTVVVNHTISFYFNPSSDIAVIITHLCDNVGMFGFTFLSGYGIYKSSRKQMANFWEKRIVNVYIPAFIVNILVLLFSLAMGNTYSRAEINDSVFMLTRQNHINGPLWYIPFIFSWYFIFYIVEIIKYKINKWMDGWMEFAARNYLYNVVSVSRGSSQRYMVCICICSWLELCNNA